MSVYVDEDYAECPECGAEFTTTTALERHEDEHSRDERTARIHEQTPDNPGYRSCRCEDFPCCGH